MGVAGLVVLFGWPRDGGYDGEMRVETGDLRIVLVCVELAGHLSEKKGRFG